MSTVATLLLESCNAGDVKCMYNKHPMSIILFLFLNVFLLIFQAYLTEISQGPGPVSFFFLTPRF